MAVGYFPVRSAIFRKFAMAARNGKDNHPRLVGQIVRPMCMARVGDEDGHASSTRSRPEEKSEEEAEDEAARNTSSRFSVYVDDTAVK